MSEKDQFKFFYPMKVGIKDINYGAHVGNDIYLSYYQEGRIAYLNHLGFSELDIGGNGIILVKAELEFKAELFHQDNIKIFCKISEMKNTSFIMDYLIEKEPDITASIGKTVLVSYDYQSKSIKKIPQVFKDRVKEIEEIK